MQAVSTTWTNLLAADHIYDFKAVINGVDYGRADIWSARIEKTLMDTCTIGEAQAAQLDMMFTPQGTIPAGAKIQCYLRLSNGADEIDITDEFDNLIQTDDGFQLASQYPVYSDWLPFGTFYIYSREKEAGGRLSVTAYDAMKKADAAYTDSGTYPKTMSAVVAVIASQLGVTLDSRSTVAAYSIPDPTGVYNIRQVLAGIAAASGGNWIVSEAGQLRLVPLASPVSTDAVPCTGYQLLSSAALTISRVTLKVDDDTSYTSGDDTGYAVTADCPYATQAMAAALYTAIKGKTYLPYTASSAYVNPAIELGDSVALDSNLSVLASAVYTIGPAMTADIGAPYDGEAPEEFPYVSPDAAALKKRLAEIKAAADAAQDAADSAQSTANTAQSTANTAQSTADTAQSSADSAYSLAQAANSTANDVDSTVQGFKYAGSSVQINGANLIADTVTASTLQGGEVDLLNGSGNNVGYIALAGASSSSYKLTFVSSGAMEIDASLGDLYLSSGYGSAFDLTSNMITSSDNFCPSSSNGAYLGLSNRYWSGAYLGSSTIVTSDRRKKRDISYDYANFDKLFDLLKPAAYKLKDGTSGRTHTGMIAQDVERAMQACGIDSADFAAFIRSPHVLKNGKIGKSYDYALRYEEFVPLLIDQVQKLKKRVDDLEKGSAN
jgi:hypothetical protein